MGGASERVVAWAPNPRGRLAAFVERLVRRHECRARDSFACALERAVEEVDRPLHRGGAAVAVDRPAIAEAAPLLLRLAERLRASEPLPSEAMRLCRLLVGDGAGPLYARSAHRSEFPPGTLSRCARAILAVCDHQVLPREPAELVEQ
jgi:hypothetical protein